MDWIVKEAADLQEELKRHRRWLHRHAEVGFQLTETLEYVRKELFRMGIDAQTCGKAGLVALIGKPDQGKTVLLRADMDALPISEESAAPFACTTGNMHACGHDLHTAMLLGAAKVLKHHEAELNGCVKLMFQPAEEIFEGAKDMIRHNVLLDPVPDAAIMIHVSAAVSMPAGTVILPPPGISAPAADYFSIHVQGKGCHGSAPHMGIDPLTAASHILLGLQEITARELPPNEAAVLTVGAFHGGTAANVIADTAVLSGTLRSYREETRDFLKSRIVSVSRSIAEAYRSSAAVDYSCGCPALINDGSLRSCLFACLQEVFDSDKVLDASEMKEFMGGSGSEDFAYISHEIPSVMLALAAGSPNDGYIYPQHHPKVTFDESALSSGTAAFVCCAMGYLSNNTQSSRIQI